MNVQWSASEFYAQGHRVNNRIDTNIYYYDLLIRYRGTAIGLSQMAVTLSSLSFVITV